MTTTLIIPAYNEAESIGAVLAQIPAGVVDEIIVVDGGSTDGTREIAEQHGARVVLETQRGYGRACAAGAAAAGGDVLVFMDADGADDPAFLPKLLAPLLAGEAELVLGSRFAGGGVVEAMPWHQRFGNRLAAGLIRLRFRLPITDLSPFRAIRAETLAALAMQEMTYGWPTEMIVKAARRRFLIREVAVPHRARIGGRSKISGTLRGTLGATYYILAVILKYSLAGTNRPFNRYNNMR